MSKAYQWEYSNASYQKVGLMICTACRKQILTGEYRFRETEEAYLPQHRSCCESDPAWKKSDEQEVVRKKRLFDMLIDAVAFKAKWNVDDLDELIIELERAK